MYLCGNCGRETDNVKQKPGELVNFWGAAIREKPQAVCPYCGGDELRPAERCDRCGRVFETDSLYGGYYCRECMEKQNDVITGTSYLQSKGAKIHYIGWIDFILRELYGITSCDYREELLRLISRRVVERLLVKDEAVIRSMHNYIADEYDDFAIWLSEGRQRYDRKPM